MRRSHRRLGVGSQPGNEWTIPPCSGVFLAVPRSPAMVGARFELASSLFPWSATKDLREHWVQALPDVRRESLSGRESCFGSAQFVGAKDLRSAVPRLSFSRRAVE
eukprot:5746607-Pyramimonas_sp.AAC.1